MVIAFSTSPPHGATVKAFQPVFPSPSSTLMSYPVFPSTWNMLVTILRQCLNSIWRFVGGVGNFSVGPTRLQSLRSIGNSALATHFASSSVERSLSSAACAPWILSLLDLLCAPASFDFVPMSLARGPFGARPPSVLCQSSTQVISAFRQDRLLHPSHSGSLLKLILGWSATSTTDSQPWLVTSTEYGWTSTDPRPPARVNPVYSRNFPFAWARLWCLARWGHDSSSTGRSARHRNNFDGCPPCNDIDGSLEHHLSHCPHHSVARISWAHSCGVAISEAPLWARHAWVFNPQHEANTLHTVRAHVRFVGLVCSQLEPPRW